ncbi:MAG: peroxidase-related enzyme [Elusimicrobia bacterium]|nr:peroxidase-related enzyme [Elusimicrobiota bacterium]
MNEEGGRPTRAWVRIIEPEDADGALKDAYEATAKSRGALAAVHKVHSLHPETLTAHMGLYKELMFGASPLGRREREAIAVAVSVTNGCAYCFAHHMDALARYEKDPAALAGAREGRWEPLGARVAALCRYAALLTRVPSEVRESDVNALRKEGFDDRAILDAAQVAAYFNFVNRLVLGLGVGLEARRDGFRY